MNSKNAPTPTLSVLNDMDIETILKTKAFGEHTELIVIWHLAKVNTLVQELKKSDDLINELLGVTDEW